MAAASLSVKNVSTLMNGLESRDKLAKLLQYLARAGAFHLLAHSSKSEWGKRLQALN